MTDQEESAQESSSSAAASSAKDSFPIVAIGASAGGLAALKLMLQKVPEDSGLAFVVVVHLDPEYKSHLAELLQSHIPIPVQQVNEAVPLQRNHLYVIPPNANLDSIDTHLRLSKLEENRRQRAPIDHFFRTLADTHDGDAVGVILTGTGSDGTLGIREIKEKGGIVIVQDPNDAEYDGMPQSAIATGMADMVLPLAKIMDAVLKITHISPRLPMVEDEVLKGDTEKQLHQVFALLRARTGRDFTRYKRATILRRIQRRMQLTGLEHLSGYLHLMRENPPEVHTLSNDLLITVTSFFRDQDVFSTLATSVIPQLFESKTTEDTIRVWSVGCATGEEAYSLAILLLEEAFRRELVPNLQVFASDMHEHSLRRAREGFYPGDIDTDVAPERLRRFFTKENGGYRIRKEVRDMVVFAPHNLLGDPPFSRLDLVSCRNLMIYLQRNVQRDIIELFHYALLPDAFLLVGTSERAETQELFRIVDKKHCIYRKQNVPPREPRLPVFPMTPSLPHPDIAAPPHGRAPLSYHHLHQRLLERYAPPSMLVSADDRLIHLSENAGRYLMHPGGEPTSNLYKNLREELRIELRAALQWCRDNAMPMSTKPIRVLFNDDHNQVVMHIRPGSESEQKDYSLVIFEEGARLSMPGAAQPAQVQQQREGEEGQLESELQLARRQLQEVVEEYETSQEEMKSAHEEMQSTNEELRSTMEELETSKEELQSMNEELQTVNQENRHKVEELAQLTDDLQNLLSATDIATLFLDRELRIMRFTPKTAELFNVRMTDRGRPIVDFSHHLETDSLFDDARAVLERLSPIEREVRDGRSGKWYLTRQLPYRSSEDRIGGVVITFVEITRLKTVQRELAQSKDYAESIFKTLHESLLLLDSDLTVRSANPAFYNQFRLRENDVLGRKVYELDSGQWDIPALRTLLEDVMVRNNSSVEYRVAHTFPELGNLDLLINASRIEHLQLILLGLRIIAP